MVSDVAYIEHGEVGVQQVASPSVLSVVYAPSAGLIKAGGADN